MTATRLIPQNVDYTDKDFDSVRARLFQLIRSVFPAWTDDSVANFGNILVEEFAFVADILIFYQDNQARESRIVTARLRKSLLGLVKLIGYSPRGASAATCDVTITLSAAVQAGASFTIPAGDRVKTAEVTTPIFYQLLEDLVFEAGESVSTVSVENSVFQSTSVTSNGLANQTFILPQTPYLDNTALVTFANGDYEQVDKFLSSTSTDRHYVIVVDQNNRATLRFGNGVNGAIPSGSGSINYKTGGGKAGRVEAGALSKMEKTSYQDSLGSPVGVTVTNASASSGGLDNETNAQIAINAPESLRLLTRAVAREDYEIGAQQISGVARALMVTNNEYAGVGENEGILFIVPVGGGTPSQELLDEVEAQFIPTGPYPKPNTFHLIVQAPSYLTVNVHSILYLKAGFSRATVKANVNAALTTLFAPQLDDGTANPNINFGFYLQDENGDPQGVFAWSDVFDIARDTAGVRKIDPGDDGFTLNGDRDDVVITPIQFPKLGNVVLVDGSDGTIM